MSGTLFFGGVGKNSGPPCILNCTIIICLPSGMECMYVSNDQCYALKGGRTTFKYFTPQGVALQLMVTVRPKGWLWLSMLTLCTPHGGWLSTPCVTSQGAVPTFNDFVLNSSTCEEIIYCICHVPRGGCTIISLRRHALRGGGIHCTQLMHVRSKGWSVMYIYCSVTFWAMGLGLSPASRFCPPYALP